MNYKYKPRCSSLGDLFSGCGKIKNELKWKDLTAMSDSSIDLAINIYNFVEYGYVKENVTTLDMHAGVELEPLAVELYDKFFKTNYEEGYILRARKDNGLINGERDLGDNKKTIDIKISTDKVVFDKKKFKPMEVEYALQLNGYGLLWGTDELELCNVLMPKTFGQIKKMVSNESYVTMLSDEDKDKLQEGYEAMYGSYETMSLESRFHRTEVPKINNFEEILNARVKTLNEWIEKNKKYL